VIPSKRLDLGKVMRVVRSAALFALGIGAAVAASGAALPSPWDRWAPLVLAVAVATGAYHAAPPAGRKDDPQD